MKAILAGNIKPIKEAITEYYIGDSIAIQNWVDEKIDEMVDLLNSNYLESMVLGNKDEGSITICNDKAEYVSIRWNQ